jgi:hypothetical protein
VSKVELSLPEIPKKGFFASASSLKYNNFYLLPCREAGYEAGWGVELVLTFQENLF